MVDTRVRGSRWRSAEGAAETKGLKPGPVGGSRGREPAARREGAGGRVRREGAGDRSCVRAQLASRAAGRARGEAAWAAPSAKTRKNGSRASVCSVWYATTARRHSRASRSGTRALGRPRQPSPEGRGVRQPVASRRSGACPTGRAAAGRSSRRRRRAAGRPSRRPFSDCSNELILLPRRGCRSSRPVPVRSNSLANQDQNPAVGEVPGAVADSQWLAAALKHGIGFRYDVTNDMCWQGCGGA